MRFLKIFLVLGLAVGLSGCELVDWLQGVINGGLSSNGINAQIDLNTGAVTWNSQTAATTDSTATEEKPAEISDLPEGWPSAVVVYTDAEIIESYTEIRSGVHTLTLRLRTSDAPQTVRDFYRGALTGAGFAVENVGTALVATNDAGALTVTAELEGGVTVAKLVYVF